MGRKHWGKGEIACYKQFLLFPQWFQKISSADKWKPGLVWEKIKRFIKPLPDNKILGWSELKQIADDILKCVQNEKLGAI